tara:strand:- start:71 stop:1354 length:1284 start_codon:yes stop_codon:yes gene_type:complete
MKYKNKDNQEIDLLGVVDLNAKKSAISDTRKKKAALNKKALEHLHKLQEKERIRQEKSDIANYKKLIKNIAIRKFNNLKKTDFKDCDFNKNEISLKDIQGIIEITLISVVEDIFKIPDKNIENFFDSIGNFTPIGEHSFFHIDEFDPTYCMYRYYDSYHFSEYTESKDIKKYISNKMTKDEIMSFSIDALFELIKDLNFEYRDLQFVPKQKNKFTRLIKIANQIYPNTFKKILNVFLDYLYDVKGKTIEATIKDNVLKLRLNVLTNIYDYEGYDKRESQFINFFYGGIVMSLLGTFKNSTPKEFDEFLSKKRFFNIGKLGNRYLTNLPRYNEESIEEYEIRHERLARLWNSGSFGEFKLDVNKKSFVFCWNYPDYFDCSSIAEIEDDPNCFISDLLNTPEGSICPDLPREIEEKAYDDIKFGFGNSS